MDEFTIKARHPREGGASFVDAASEVTETPSKISLEAIEPKDENEKMALRAVRAQKSAFKNYTTGEENSEVALLQKEFIREPENQDSVKQLLKEYSSTLELKDIDYFLTLLVAGSFPCEPLVYFKMATYDYSHPQGFSQGDWLDIRRTIIKRYLDEVSTDEELWGSHERVPIQLGNLIRDQVYCYTRGEDVLPLMQHGQDLRADQNRCRPEDRPQWNAYIHAVLRDTLDNLDNEQLVVDEINELSRRVREDGDTVKFNVVNPSIDNGGMYEKGYLEVRDREGKVVETIRPKLPMIAGEYKILQKIKN